jgi:DNA-binding MurR/RpiR family transcriptional regulator
MDTNAITDAVQAIMAADFVYIFGLGSSYAIGYDLQHKLMRAGIKAYAEEDSHFQAIDATNCTSRDVVFAISNSGKSLDIVTNSQIAKDSGATVISLTNTLVNSPLSKISDIAIRTAESQTESVIGMSPRLAQMAVVDTLYTLITMNMKNVSERSRQLDEIFKGLK